MAKVVLVIDMIKGFMESGHPLYCGARARHIIPHVQQLLQEQMREGAQILYLCDQHIPDDPEFEMFPPHCIKGTHETEIIAELVDYPGKIVPKTRYSAFTNSILEEELIKIKPQSLIVCGVCTDICVMHTVTEAMNRLGYKVAVPVDCVTSFNEEAHRFALDHMGRVLGAVLFYADEIKPPQPHFTVSEEILRGYTTDIYFDRSVEILKKESINPLTTMEVFASKSGILCGIEEVKILLENILPEDNREVWALKEGDDFCRKEVVLRITAPFQSYGKYETIYLGMLSHCSGWATAARQCIEAAQGIPVISFGARHVHPSVAGIMDYAAVVGGCKGCSSISGAKFAGIEPSGTIPHALILILGSTIKAVELFDRYMPGNVPRIALVDTFRDEPEESIEVAKALQGKLEAVRLDTPGERGGVTTDLVKETRARLDQVGFTNVKIVVSGGVNPDRIYSFINSGAPVDFFGVGSYITAAPPIDFTADIHQIDGKPIAKRGRIPGITVNHRLARVL
jgi:nicotinate phosphoribosyltransferase